VERLKLDLIQLKKSLKTLKSAFDIERELQKTCNPLFILAAQDSIIQRFEYCYEGFWKFLKRYLELIHMLNDINSPKKVFKACVKIGLCSTSEGDMFIDMADDRNETLHTCNVESMRLILPEIPEYYLTIINIVQQVETHLNV